MKKSNDDVKDWINLYKIGDKVIVNNVTPGKIVRINSEYISVNYYNDRGGIQGAEVYTEKYIKLDPIYQTKLAKALE